MNTRQKVRCCVGRHPSAGLHEKYMGRVVSVILTRHVLPSLGLGFDEEQNKSKSIRALKLRPQNLAWVLVRDRPNQHADAMTRAQAESD
jgi:hypothetical protein